jgi:cell filamentation protein, protein adenylyltransferase
MAGIEPHTRFKRYPVDLVSRLSRISAALARIEAADLWPAAAEQLRFSAKVGTIHYSTLIEGNTLSVLEAERAARGELDGETRAQIELVNYVDALDLIDELHESGTLEITPDFIKQLHLAATKGLGTEDGPFKPHHEGAWRDGEAAVIDHLTKRVVHEGSPQAEVEPRMIGLCDWIASKELDFDFTPPFVIAGMAHYVLTDVHPFADGNGRVARLFTVALLVRFGVLPGRLFNFEEYYGRDTQAYYTALRAARDQLNHEPWLEYFLEGMALEYERVAQAVTDLAELGRVVRGKHAQLKNSQQAALSDFRLRGVSEFARADYEAATDVPRATAVREINELLEMGLVKRVGDGRTRRYQLVGAAQANPWAGRGGGRPKSWTDERIDTELRAFVGDREEFPTRSEFVDTGHSGLYLAVVRNGGTGRWSERLGIGAPRRGGRPR